MRKHLKEGKKMCREETQGLTRQAVGTLRQMPHVHTADHRIRRPSAQR